jgi:DNA modification methylase
MTAHFAVGDCREVLPWLPDGCVQTCVTSPPYFGLRDYGHAEQIGLEDTPDAFVGALVEVFREVRRVLADDGTLWLNLGDSYCTSPKGNPGVRGNINGGKRDGAENDTGASALDKSRLPGLKPKDLIGIPWRVAFALQADGWWLRQDIIWHKPNPMPESVTDRCTKAHEYVFLLSKSSRYYWDAEAMQEPVQSDKGNAKSFRGGAYCNNATFDNATGGNRTVTGNTRSKRDSFKREGSKRAAVIPGQSVGTHREDRPESDYPLDTRNRRSVWSVATRPFKGAHFATFPPALIEPCIAAGCPRGGMVLDPFGGAGTTALVAERLGRNSISIELNPDYVALARARLQGVLPCP